MHIRDFIKFILTVDQLTVFYDFKLTYTMTFEQHIYIYFKPSCFVSLILWQKKVIFQSWMISHTLVMKLVSFKFVSKRSTTKTTFQPLSDKYIL